MHTKLIEHTSHENLKSFTKHLLDELKVSNHAFYEEQEMELYVMTNGYHFNEWMLDCAIKNMINEDGSKGAHWSLEQTTSVAQSLGANFSSFNKYDFNYVMNMLYSDLYGSVNASASEYGKMALKWLSDKDAKDGKAFRYYWAISLR